MAFGRLLADYLGPDEAWAGEDEDRLARDSGVEAYLSRYGRGRIKPAPMEDAATDALSREGGHDGGGSLLALAARLGLPIAGSVLGALSPVPGGAYVGGGLGSAAGEALGEWIDGQPLDPAEIGLQGVVGAVPFVGKATSPLRGALLRGAEGAVLGGASELARSALHGRDPEASDLLTGTALGGAFGTAGGMIEGALAARAARAAQGGADLLTDLAHQRAQQTDALDAAYHQSTAEILDQLPPQDRAMYDAFREGRISLVKPGPDGMPVPFDPDQYARLTAAQAQHEAVTQQWEAAKGWTPEQQGAAHAQTSPDPMQGYEEGAAAAEEAAVRRRRVTDRTPGDDAADAAFVKADAARHLDADRQAVEQVVSEIEPTLGQMGLPGVGPASSALSAADPERLAPSIIDHISAPEDVKGLLGQLTEQNREMIGDARRGVQTRAEREAAARPIALDLADRLGTDPDKFVAGLRRRGEAANAEQLQAMSLMLDGAAGDFAAAAKQAAANPDDPEAMLRAYKAMTVARGLVAQKAGAVAETGRALAALRKAEQSNLQGAAFEKLLNEAGTSPQAMQEILRRAAMLDDPREMQRFMTEAGTATTFDQIHEAWQSGILSGSLTFMRNLLGNTAALSLRIPEDVAAAGYDTLRATVTGTPRERFFGEAVADTVGMLRGVVGGSRAALRTFKTEMPTLFPGAEQRIYSRHAIPGKAGRIVRLPYRFIGAADEFFKGLSSEGSIYAQAYREAAQEGAKGRARLDRLTQLVTQDRARLKDLSRGEALYRTFQSEDKAIPRALTHLRNQIDGARYVVPFINTVWNVAGFGAERTPLGLYPFAKRVLNGSADHGEAVDRLARMTVGAGLAGAVVAMVGDGGITGAAPLNPGEKNALLGTGWRPNSIRLGDDYYSFAGIEPISTILGTTADAVQLFNDPLVAREDIATRLAFGYANRLSEQPFLTGLQDVLDARENPRSAERYLKRFATTAIPNAVGTIARALDPTVRKGSGSVADLARAKIPGLSDDLPPIRNVWGEPVTRTPSGAEGLVNPIARSPIATDPASMEVRRLVHQVGLGIGAPTPTISEKGVRTPMTPGDYDALTMRVGQIAKAQVTKLVTSPGYQRLTDDDRKADLIEGIFKKARQQARSDLKTVLAARRRTR